MKIKNFVEKSLVSSLYTTQLLFSRQIERTLKKLDLNYVEALVLSGLFFEGEKEIIGPARLSNVLGIKKARASQALTKLTRLGYIRREIHSSDSRKFKLILEPTGAKKASQVIKAFDSLETKIESHLGSVKSSNLQKDLIKLSTCLKV